MEVHAKGQTEIVQNGGDIADGATFYFPHIMYGKYWFRFKKYVFIANFHVLGLFLPKK
jgi:hypothetical protein